MNKWYRLRNYTLNMYVFNVRIMYVFNLFNNQSANVQDKDYSTVTNRKCISTTVLFYYTRCGINTMLKA